MKPIIQSEKHYVQFAQSTLAVNSLVQKIAVVAVAVVNKDFQNEVEEGSIIKAVYFEMWVKSTSTGQDFGVATVEKIPGAGDTQTFTESNNLNVYNNKKNILWTFEGLYPSSTVNPIPIIRAWIKIPKSKQRFGLNDKLVINLSTGSASLLNCGFMTYKEYK